MQAPLRSSCADPRFSPLVWSRRLAGVVDYVRTNPRSPSPPSGRHRRECLRPETATSVVPVHDGIPKAPPSFPKWPVPAARCHVCQAPCLYPATDIRESTEAANACRRAETRGGASTPLYTSTTASNLIGDRAVPGSVRVRRDLPRRAASFRRDFHAARSIRVRLPQPGTCRGRRVHAPSRP